ncbi:hypothetical protein KPH14_006747 [Odynerus spinipes]|uniref:Uncharacterized protein n=1 Tax=Odynerus spinipes TaxID=1348599 RepID=A0AAD9VRQ4_9HYME|nr:hypothetical protein KPH14_006747 [Odynerus spinipes]
MAPMSRHSHYNAPLYILYVLVSFYSLFRRYDVLPVSVAVLKCRRRRHNEVQQISIFLAKEKSQTPLHRTFSYT